jgi:rubredoxin
MCSCIEDVNRDLAEHNAVLVTTLFREPNVAVIGTEKRDSKKRGRPPAMLATYCPFCGLAYDAKQPLPSSGRKPCVRHETRNPQPVHRRSPIPRRKSSAIHSHRSGSGSAWPSSGG